MINSLPNMDPESYAKQYASENNISVEEARTQLKAKYGDPKAQQSQENSSIFAKPTKGGVEPGQLSLDDLNLEDDEEIGSMTIKQLLMAILGLLRGILGNEEDDEDFDYEYGEVSAVNVEDVNVSKDELITSHEEIAETSDKKSDETESTNNKTDETEKTSEKNDQKTKDDYYKTIADACGIDELTASAIAKAVADGSATGRPEEVVPKLAYDLGLPEDTVAKVLKYLNNGSI